MVLDITVHDADTLRFVLDDEPLAVERDDLARRNEPRGTGGRRRWASCASPADCWRNSTTPSRRKYAATGFEVHGELGSLIGRDCMTQAPKGEVLLRTAAGEESLKLEHENLYARGVRLFQEAVAGRGAPSATGEDGIKSLSVALAALEAARSGAETAIDLRV